MRLDITPDAILIETPTYVPAYIYVPSSNKQVLTIPLLFIKSNTDCLP